MVEFDFGFSLPVVIFQPNCLAIARTYRLTCLFSSAGSLWRRMRGFLTMFDSTTFMRTSSPESVKRIV
jgi:hypothetical protein